VWVLRSWWQLLAGLIAVLAIAGCGAATSPDATTARTGTATAPARTATAPTRTATAPAGTATVPTRTATAPARTATVPATTTTTPDHLRTAARLGTALAALGKLAVKGRAPKTGYSRDRFGPGWASVSGCYTRDRILRRDLTRKRFVAGSCRVRSGVLFDPYTGQIIKYVRGGASEVDIDHVVALSDAWQKGAQQWSYRKRVTFANDPLELLAVGASVNRAKGDGDAATWLPPRRGFRCAFVARQIAIKRRYGLWVTAAERNAMRRVLDRCPHQRLPNAASLPAPSISATAPPPSRPAPAPAPNAGGVRVFKNCAAVRAAGLAPIRRGTPLYNANKHLDRDKDGLACE